MQRRFGASGAQFGTVAAYLIGASVGIALPGRGPAGVLRRLARAAPVLVAATALMQALIAKAAAPR